MYDRYVSSAQFLASVWRYPDDKYDRWWASYSKAAWANISTNATVAPNAELEDPSLVIQTAATSLTTKEPLVMNWTNDNMSATYCVILHFAEIQLGNISKTARREFNIFGKGSIMSSQPYTPALLSTQFIDFNYTNALTYNISLEATLSSTLPPLLNAIELYTILPVTATTYAQDGN
ncbi:hypothetical protein LUZ63_000957 [Rhynchospora breviuscula]|uniref:Malectin-like domain-containing protein n=1 Tax=Rhynchospora breviuscula TaxID=2022672 RepID=A0A9Q0CWE2_9POAL|nr:hypothetical protein LUZ63_000957 [Rhynchospora breviuscula]